MSDSFTVLWTKEHCDRLGKEGDEGKPLLVLFGGVHQSAPSLKRAGMGAGDVVFPLLVHKGALHIVARAVIKGFISLDTYVVEHLGLDRESTLGLPEFQLLDVISQRLGPLGHRMPYGCGIEVALVERSTPIKFNVVLPPQTLTAIAFCPRKGRPIGLRHIENGLLKSALSLQGNVRRLSPEGARLFSEAVAGVGET